MLNIPFENSIDAMKKSNIINDDIWINNKNRKKTVWDTAESSDADDQIFKNDITDNNLLNSKIRNIYARVKSNIRRSNWLTEIENLLNNIGRRTSTATFATIDEVLIEKEWNAIKIEKFGIEINDCNSEDFLIVSLIFRNRPFTIFSKQSILSMNYAKKKNNDTVAIIENTNFDIFVVVSDLSIS